MKIPIKDKLFSKVFKYFYFFQAFQAKRKTKNRAPQVPFISKSNEGGTSKYGGAAIAIFGLHLWSAPSSHCTLLNTEKVCSATP